MLILVLCLTCTQVFGTIQDSEFDWAFKYLTETLENVEKPNGYPEGFLVEMPTDEEGWALKDDTHPLKWWDRPVTIWGTVLLKRDWTFRSINDRAILIHEACHILDMKTPMGCRCDPYSITYHYMYENGYSIEQIRVLYKFKMHDVSRMCKLKGTLSKQNELESNSKSHSVP